MTRRCASGAFQAGVSVLNSCYGSVHQPGGDVVDATESSLHASILPLLVVLLAALVAVVFAGWKLFKSR
jgi:hypothetical protein